MEKLCPELLFTGKGELLENKVLIHDKGEIIGMRDQNEFDPVELHFYKGIICPGFINTHCHLELSHMKGMADTGTGLLAFLNKVVGFRDIEQDIIDQAIVDADKEMYLNGIVAVGDISNKSDTAIVKSQSPIVYHTFVEMFDFMQPNLTEKAISQYKPVFDLFAGSGPDKLSFSPHAPYTVSKLLFEYINEQNKGLQDITVSIHNQETVHEDLLFQMKKGGFIDFYKGFGIDIANFESTDKNSIHYAMENMDYRKRTLFVHNTCSTIKDIEDALHWGQGIFWATCANANLYIENQLPDYQLFRNVGATMTIGTDSLTSNWQLSVLEEIKTINKYQSYIPVEELLTWATSNGAKALGFEDSYGHFTKGTKPGILLINCQLSNEGISLSNAGVVRLD